MKKIIAALTALFMAGLVFAPSANASVKDDKLFYKLVVAEAPAFKSLTRKELVKSAKETCKFLRAGFTILDAAEIAMESGFSQNESTALIAGAIVFYCPEQENNW